MTNAVFQEIQVCKVLIEAEIRHDELSRGFLRFQGLEFSEEVRFKVQDLIMLSATLI